MPATYDGNPDRLALLVDEDNDSVVDPVQDAVRVVGVGPGGATSTVVTDIEDGAGDSIMDAANDALRATVPNGLDVNAGATTDAAVTTDVNATLSAKLRGLVKILGNVWDSVNSRLKVAVEALVTPANRSVTDTLTAAADTVELDVPGCSTASIRISGTWSGTILFEGTANGTNWVTSFVIVPGTGRARLSVTTNGTRLMPCGAYKKIRANAAGWTSGTATVDIEASVGSQVQWLATGAIPFDFDTDAPGEDVGAGFGLAIPTASGAELAGHGANPLRIAVTDTSDTTVKPGDATNNAVRVNVVTGALATSATATRTSVASTTTPGTTILAANTSRKGAMIYNDSNQVLFLAFGSGATTTDFSLRMTAQSVAFVEFSFTGVITGAARITEFT